MTPSWHIEVEAPVNGRPHKAAITVKNDAGDVALTDYEDLRPVLGREKLAKRLAEHLGVDATAIGQEIESRWNAAVQQRRQEQQEQPAGEPASCKEELLALADCADFFHGLDGRPYAAVPVGDKGDPRRDTLPVRHESFRDWLCRRYYLATRRAAPSVALQAVLNVLVARACYDGPARDVRVRVGGAVGTVGTIETPPVEGGAIYVALGDDQLRAVEVDYSGWRLVSAPPVFFRRPKGQKPLPEPTGGGRIDDLRPLLNVAAEEWPLVVGWVAQALNPRGPYPLLCLHGEQGVAKSTTARVLKELVDPSVPMLRTPPRDERDLCIGASNNWVLALDNLSDLRPWLSDALCRLSTGGGLATRQLYTDEDEAIFDVQRPVILTGIEDLAARPDALDRSIILTLEPINDAERLSERRYWARVEAVLPRVLGALLDGLSEALRMLPHVEAELTVLPRMADFAIWMEAAARSLGFPPGTALNAYLANRAAAAGKALDASILTGPFRAWLKANRLPWEGTCETLLTELNRLAGDAARRRGWPETPRALSGALRRLSPILRTLQIAVDLDHKTGRDRERHRVVRIERVPPMGCAQPSPPAPAWLDGDGGDGGDGRAGRSPGADGMVEGAAGPAGAGERREPP
jgi:hypothetical protein